MLTHFTAGRSVVCVNNKVIMQPIVANYGGDKNEFKENKIKDN